MSREGTTAPERVRRTYARLSRLHDPFAWAFSLGQEARLRREAVGLLSLRPGDAVLDLACGTGANFPALQEAVGPSGRILGLDLSEAMLTRARERVEARGWRNVNLVLGDATRLAGYDSFAAAISTLALGFIPNRRDALEQMVGAVRPGGRVLVADVKLCDRWYGAVLNPVVWLLAIPWIPPGLRRAYLFARPWKDLEPLVDDFAYEERLGGIVYIASGQRRG